MQDQILFWGPLDPMVDRRLKTIRSLTSDLKKLIKDWSNFCFFEGVVPLNYVKQFV